MLHCVNAWGVCLVHVSIKAHAPLRASAPRKGREPCSRRERHAVRSVEGSPAWSVVQMGGQQPHDQPLPLLGYGGPQDFVRPRPLSGNDGLRFEIGRRRRLVIIRVRG